MCGIAGYYDVLKETSETQIRNRLTGMTRALRHRGPDDIGEWTDLKNGLGLGHVRLSILDLSSAGHQPMLSPSKRYCITYNGEIYNYRELRQQLKQMGTAPRGNSDTAVLLAAFDAWGVAGTLPKLVGMFAFGVWDSQERCLHVARDRMGEKPLFFGWLGRSFVFASELKALRSCSGWDHSISRDSLALFMRYGYIPAPYSIYKGIFKLMPGSVLSIDAYNGTTPLDFSPWPDDPGASLKPRTYWSIESASERRRNRLFTSPDQAAEQLESLLRDAVRHQMVADVPLGAFLSGGVDSSTVVALMQSESTMPIKTFTIGFDVPGFDEAEYAASVARHLGTDHTDLYVTADEAMAVIPSLPMVYDEPHADASHIPTILVSGLARKHVTVSLSGDGGDELFCGYNRYLHSNRIWRGIKWFPFSIRRGLSNAIRSVSPKRWDAFFNYLPGRLPRMGYKMHKLSDGIRANNVKEVYKGLISYWHDPSSLVKDSVEPLSTFDRSLDTHGDNSILDQMIYWDQMAYLPDDNLTKMDRASMSVGLETRAPLLDHRIVEFSWQLSNSLKIRDNQSKWLLRQLLYKYVPKHLIERPKMGFSVPIGQWLRGSLREWSEDLLDSAALKKQGLLDAEMVSKVWHDHLSGKIEGQNSLWAVLMFQSWYRTFESQ